MGSTQRHGRPDGRLHAIPYPDPGTASAGAGTAEMDPSADRAGRFYCGAATSNRSLFIANPKSALRLHGSSRRDGSRRATCRSARRQSPCATPILATDSGQLPAVARIETLDFQLFSPRRGPSLRPLALLWPESGALRLNFRARVSPVATTQPDPTSSSSARRSVRSGISGPTRRPISAFEEAGKRSRSSRMSARGRCGWTRDSVVSTSSPASRRSAGGT